MACALCFVSCLTWIKTLNTSAHCSYPESGPLSWVGTRWIFSEPDLARNTGIVRNSRPYGLISHPCRTAVPQAASDLHHCSSPNILCNAGTQRSGGPITQQPGGLLTGAIACSATRINADANQGRAALRTSQTQPSPTDWPVRCPIRCSWDQGFTRWVSHWRVVAVISCRVAAGRD